MPVSLEHGSIFVHVPKTAGTSMEKALGIYGRRECLHGLTNKGSMQHWTALEIAEFLGKILYNKFFSFGFIRNPWDRLVSEYAYLKKEKSPFVRSMSFRDFVLRLPVQQGSVQHHIFQHLRPQSNYFFDSFGKPLVDYIGTFEKLSICWHEIVDEIKNRFDVQLPCDLGKEQISRHDHYSTYYDSELREHAARVYEVDIRFFKYEFDNR